MAQGRGWQGIPRQGPGVRERAPQGAYWVIVSTLAVAIAGAVTAYFTNMIDPKEIKKTFEVKGLKIDAAVDLGKFQERVLQSAKLGLSGKAGPGTLGVEGPRRRSRTRRRVATSSAPPARTRSATRRKARPPSSPAGMPTTP